MFDITNSSKIDHLYTVELAVVHVVFVDDEVLPVHFKLLLLSR